MKTLLAIANFGTKNQKYLHRVLEEYRTMKRYKPDIVVLSDIPKDLGSDIEVIVGLPTKDPWSLPFRHKTLFAKRMEQYELFIYSEDDILITEKNIDLFLDATRVLPEEYILGFMRFEISDQGEKYYNDFYNRFHWDPNSVMKINKYIFAHHTNEHSGCFILTQHQLTKSIYSGGFLLPPRMGRYGTPETAATDPYTQCGMKKLICISHPDESSVQHLPNNYIGKMGIDAELAVREMEWLKSIDGTNTVRGPLFDTRTLFEDATWDKRYYEPCRRDILSLVPKSVKQLLSVGCACGTTESELVEQGIDVVGIPLDGVIQVGAEARGVKVVPPDFEAAKQALIGVKFDCILFQDVLHHMHDPASIIRDFLNFLGKSGSIIISVPNFHHLSSVREKMLEKLLVSDATDWHAFEKYKLHFTTRRMLDSWLEKCGLKVVRSYRQIERHHEWLDRFTLGTLKGILSKNVVVLCKTSTGR